MTLFFIYVILYKIYIAAIRAAISHSENMDRIRAEKIQRYVDKVLKDCKQGEELTNKELLKRIKLAEWEDERNR